MKNIIMHVINRVLCLTTVFYYILDVKAIQALTEDGNTPAVHTQ